MPWKPKQKVVVPIDYSNAAVDAIQTGIDAAESANSVYVVHSLPELDPNQAFGRMSTEYVKERREGAFRNLHDFLRRNGATDVQTEVLDGDPGRRIVEFAADVDADLIVMPSHGYHGYQRLVLGSTTERVLRHAHCPVFVLRHSSKQD